MYPWLYGVRSQFKIHFFITQKDKSKYHFLTQFLLIGKHVIKLVQDAQDQYDEWQC